MSKQSESTAETKAVHAGQTEKFNAPSLSRSILIGGLGFALTSTWVFATVAFAERWMYANLGLAGSYLAWVAIFILLGGGVLGTLVSGPWRLPKFYLLFGLAFLVYAVGWISAYFTFRGATGEWIGSLAGSILLGSVLAAGFGRARTAVKVSMLLFVTNSVGYFLGSALNDYFGGRPGMLLWGIAYGVGLGAGLGAVLHTVQMQSDSAEF